MTDFSDLSTTDLAKQINDEYALILASERTNLQRALNVGEKLIALRQRVKHGEWQAKLKGHCPSISYETANLYIRLAENRNKLEAYAKAKSVAVTDLTLQEARTALAKPKADNANANKPSKAVKASVEPAIESRRDEAVAKEYLRPLEFDELAVVLREMFDAEYLAKLARAITPTQVIRPPVTSNAEFERRA